MMTRPIRYSMYLSLFFCPLYCAEEQQFPVQEIHVKMNDLIIMDETTPENNQLNQKLSELKIDTPFAKTQAEKIISKISSEHYSSFLQTFTDLMDDIEDQYRLYVLTSLYNVAPSLYALFSQGIQSLCNKIDIKKKMDLIQIYSLINPKLYTFLNHFFINNKFLLNYVPTVDILLNLEGITMSKFLDVPIGVFYQDSCSDLMTQAQLENLFTKLHNTYYTYAPQGTPSKLLFLDLSKKSTAYELSDYYIIIQKLNLGSLPQDRLKSVFFKLDPSIFTAEFIYAVEELSKGLDLFDKKHIIHALKNLPSKSISSDLVLSLKLLTNNMPALKRATILSGLSKIHPSLLPLIKETIEKFPSFFDCVPADHFKNAMTSDMTEQDLLEALELLKADFAHTHVV